MKRKFAGICCLLFLGFLILFFPQYAFASKERYFGVDISQHQGYIDWDAVAPNVDFVILRCGFAEDYLQYDDSYWEYNVSACERLAIPYGVYLYSYMETESDALGEADHAIRLLSGHHPSLPVFLDLEDAKVAALSNDQIVQYTNLWLGKIRDAGYEAGVYTSYNWWTNRLGGLSLNSKYKWLAAWSSGYESTAKSYAIWQYTNSGSVPGISGSVDCDYCWDLTQWIEPAPVTHYVSYDANGGTNAPESHINSGSISAVRPTRTGYDFVGWNTDRDATTASYQPGTVCLSDIDLTLYAIWRRQTFTVSFDADGGTPVESIVVAYGERIPFLPTSTKCGFAFQGWYSGNTLFSEQTVITQNLQLKAHWEAIQLSRLVLPTALTTVESEAFAGSATNVIVIPSGVKAIGSRAFADNTNLYAAIIYSSTVTPASDAFANCPNLTIYGIEDTPVHYYAVAKKIPFVALSDSWVQDSEAPFGATVIEEKWTYTETAESTSPNMTGWVQDGTDWRMKTSGVSKYVNFSADAPGFSTGHNLYSKYSPASKKTETETENAKTVLGTETTVGYIYWHWTLDGEWANQAANAGRTLNVYIESSYGPNPDGYTYTRFNAFETSAILTPVDGKTTSNDHIDLTGNGIYSTCYVDNATYNLPEYVSYWWYIAPIRQQSYTDYEKVYIFTRNGESATEIQPRDDITNIQHWVKYGF